MVAAEAVAAAAAAAVGVGVIDSSPLTLAVVVVVFSVVSDVDVGVLSPTIIPVSLLLLSPAGAPDPLAADVMPSMLQQNVSYNILFIHNNTVNTVDRLLLCMSCSYFWIEYMSTSFQRDNPARL